MSVIHQKNSNPLVITGFEGFCAMFNYIKVKGGVKSNTNRESPCRLQKFILLQLYGRELTIEMHNLQSEGATLWTN